MPHFLKTNGRPTTQTASVKVQATVKWTPIAGHEQGLSAGRRASSRSMRVSPAR